jgi:hypothetical protein
MDYAKKANAAHWLRHPIIGDPSFDAFEKTGTIHRSSPPFEWAVNGSLFADFDGIWYLYAGLYPEGYRVDPDAPSHFIIYRSADKGKNWVCLGEGFEKGFRFDGHAVPSDHFPILPAASRVLPLLRCGRYGLRPGYIGGKEQELPVRFRGRA